MDSCQGLCWQLYWALGEQWEPPTSAPLLLRGANLANFGCEGPAAGQGRSRQSDTALIYTAALSLKHPRGQVSIETPPKHEHTQPNSRPRNCAAEPSVPGKRLHAAGIAARREKPLLRRLPEPGNAAAAAASLLSLFRSCARCISQPCPDEEQGRGCGWQPSPCSRMAVEQLQGWGCSKDSTRRGGHQVSVFRSSRGQWDAEGPRGARPAGSPRGFLQERDRRDEPERQFPEPVFALAAPASVPHSPDAQLLGGIAASLKPGLAAGLLSGWGQGSSQGLGGGQCPHTAFLPRCCQAELSQWQPHSGTVPAQEAQAGGTMSPAL